MAPNGKPSDSEIDEWIREMSAARQIESSAREPGEQAVKRALRYMGENYHRPELQLKDVAAATHVSSSHLAHLLRTQTGASYVKHLTSLRMAEGKRLLAETDLKIAEIAVRTGYDAPAYFYRVFRQQVGMTPSEYRRQVCGPAGEMHPR